MLSHIYNFSIECAGLLSACENKASIFAGIISAYYLYVNSPSANITGVCNLRDAIYNNLDLVNKMLPEPMVRANFLGAEANDLMREISARLIKLDKHQFIDNPEIIGWMYQYFNKPGRTQAYIGLRKNIKISSGSLAPATQIFTPKWIARYLTENAIGRIASPDGYTPGAKYFIPDANYRLDLSISNPLRLKLLDPCMGCGNILLSAFDVLMDLYISKGYDPGAAAQSILAKNLYGLDVDPIAVNLGYFALIMRAAAFDADIINRSIRINLFSFNGFTPESLELGSLLESEMVNSQGNSDAITLLSQKYDIIVTNPPYMGNHNMSRVLSEFVKKNYPLSKTDLSTVFMERSFKLCKARGIVAMINIHAWLFLPTYENFREYLINNKTIISMLDLDLGVFKEAALIRPIAFLMGNFYEPAYTGTFVKLYDQHDKLIYGDKKEQLFFDADRRYYRTGTDFLKIPRKIFAYSITDGLQDIMNTAQKLTEAGKPRQGLKTGDNARFIRLWHQVPKNEICFNAGSREEALKSGCKWFPYNKAGEYRKWYGNNRYVVNWEQDGAEIRGFKDEKGKQRSRPQNMDYYFKSSVSWNMISSVMSARFIPKGFIFDGAGGGIFSQHNYYLLGYLNSFAATKFLNVTSQSINYNVGQIADLPLIISGEYYEAAVGLVRRCIEISKEDWDDYEASWDFTQHPLVKIILGIKDRSADLSECCRIYDKTRSGRYNLLKENEEKLERIFAKIYSLPLADCPEAKPTITKTSLKDDIVSLISFATGCVFGRYSCPGFFAVKGSQISFDSAADLYIRFLEAAFGREKLAENLMFSAAVLGDLKDKPPRDVIRDYFSRRFINDHERMYLKRPVYIRHGNGIKINF